MLNINKAENKRIMLEEMKNNGWETDVDINSSYDKVEEAFNEMKNEYESAEDAMYPNGRDWDAENYDD